MSKQILARWMFTLGFMALLNVALSQKKHELTVKEAVELAFDNVTTVKNAALDYQIQKAQNNEITGQALPQVSGTASLNRYLQLPKILFPDASESGIYSVLKNEKLIPDNAKIPDPKLQAISFFQPWNTSIGCTL